jgi:hypothetical protein
VVYGDRSGRLAPETTKMKHLSGGLRLLIISAADFKANAMASFEQVGCGHNLDGELIDSTRDQGLWIGVGVGRLPRLRPLWVYLISSTTSLVACPC